MNLSSSTLWLCTLNVLFGLSGSQLTESIIYDIDEESPINTYVGNVVDSANLSELYSPEVFPTLRYYFLALGKSYEEHFTLNSKTGRLTTARTVDRDVICARAATCRIPLDVQVQPSSNFRIIKLLIEVNDINDNSPTFPEDEITRRITEASSLGSQITIPLADDPDSPRYGIDHYEILPSTDAAMFYLWQGLSGEDLYLVLNGSLDRESLDLYTVMVAAYDGGNPTPRSGVIVINIQVQDVNDNNPRFTNRTYAVTVEEHVPQYTRIVTVSATDPDEGLNGEVVYGFSSNTEAAYGDIFMIDGSTGEVIIIGDVDYELETQYSLTITANDRNPDSIPATAKLIVTVIDINDHSPSIKLNTVPAQDGHLKLSEFSSNGTFIAHITVNDADSGPAGDFTCSLSDHKFSLQRLYETEFKMVTMASFNHEIQSSYELTMRCEDGAEPPLAKSRKFIIDILDENDNAPIFSQKSYSGSIQENKEPGDMVVTVSAMDMDSGENARITYHLLDDDLPFDIDPITGNLTANVALDREDQDFYNLTVLAVDHGRPQLRGSAIVAITVTDDDDEIPTFIETQYNFTVGENQPIGTFVGRADAADLDSARYNEFIFSIADESTSEVPFTIDVQSGVIRTKSVLDREKRRLYKFTAKVKSTADETEMSMCDINIRVMDANDNSPVIDFPTRENNTVKYLHSGNKRIYQQRIAHILAHDVDEGVNQELTYVLLNSSEEVPGLFLDPNSGILVVNDSTSLANYQENLELRILVRDSGSPLRSTEASLTISVSHTSVSEGNANLPIMIAVIVISIVIIIFLIIFIIRTRKRIEKERKLKWMAAMVDPRARPLQNTESDTLRKGSWPNLEKKAAMEDANHNVSTALGHEAPLPRLTYTPSVSGSVISSASSGGIEKPQQRVSIASSSGYSVQANRLASPSAYANQGYESSASDNGSDGSKPRHSRIYHREHKIKKPAVFNPNPDMHNGGHIERDDRSSVVDSGRGSSTSDMNRSTPVSQADLDNNYMIEEEDLSLDPLFNIPEPDSQPPALHRSCIRSSSYSNNPSREVLPPPWMSRTLSNLNVRFHLPEDQLGSIRSLDASTLSSMSTMSSYGGALI